MNFQIVYLANKEWCFVHCLSWNQVQSMVRFLQKNGFIILGVNKRTSGNFIQAS